MLGTTSQDKVDTTQSMSLVTTRAWAMSVQHAMYVCIQVSACMDCTEFLSLYNLVTLGSALASSRRRCT